MRRDELYSSEASEGDDVTHGHKDEATRAKLNERLARMFSLDEEIGPSNEDGPDEVMPDAEDPEPAFEFRLFSTAGSAPKVMVHEEDEGDGDILASRPASYHMRQDYTPEELERFREVAVDYADVVREAKQRAWGLEVPWRVTKITVKSGPSTPSTPQKGSKGNNTTEEPARRKRPGKKRRVALRMKEKEKKLKEEEKKAKAEAAAKQRLTKEEHLKEKRKRLNREKKLKRRQKDKEKKQAGKPSSGGGSERPEGESDSDSSDGEDS